jgi:hypothetical protein
MLKIFKNKKAQNTAEYAILIALVVGGVIAMQTYAQRTLQGRLRDASVTLRDQTANMDGLNGSTTLQYEPYYTNTASVMDKGSEKTQTIDSQTDTSLSTKRTNSVDRTEYLKGRVAGNTSADSVAGF